MSRTCLILTAMGAVGVASLGLAPLETLIPPEAGVSVPRPLLLIQPMLLMLICAGLGCWATARVGLSAPILNAESSDGARWKMAMDSAKPAVAAGLCVALILVGYHVVTKSTFMDLTSSSASSMLRFEPPLITKLLYGGLAEEIIARWGIMSVVALFGLKLGMRRGHAIGLAIVVAALAFGLGHLPFLYALMPSPPAWLIAVVMIGNIVPGLIFGLLFARHGIESAMIAHASGHFFATMSVAIL
jgi:Type II CAAX prenyl endopeptidase Rce1-like